MHQQDDDLSGSSIEVGRKRLTVAAIAKIARGASVSLAPGILSDLEQRYAQAEKISARISVYGRSTGVGGNRLTSVAPEDDEHGMRLLRSHAADVGPPVPHSAVRGMLAVRLSQLARGGSGIKPEIVSGLERMIQTNALPDLKSVGGIGTGDLAALAGTGLAMTGERSTTVPFKQISPFGMESALPFMSSSALTISRAALALDELHRLERAGRVIAALSALAVRANPQAFSKTAARATAAPEAPRVALEMRKLLKRNPGPARIQDPYGFRSYVPSHGAVLAAMKVLQTRLEELATSAQENPLFNFSDSKAVHHGNFHQVALALALDGMNLALAQCAPLVISRTTMLHEPAFTGLAPFLARGPSGASGHMMTEYVSAAALAELRAAAHPASLGTVTLSRGAEEDASFATQAVVQFERAVQHYRPLLAVELLSAHRAIYQLGMSSPKRLHPAIAHLRRKLPVVDADHDLRPELESASALLDDLADGVL